MGHLINIHFQYIGTQVIYTSWFSTLAPKISYQSPFVTSLFQTLLIPPKYLVDPMNHFCVWQVFMPSSRAGHLSNMNREMTFWSFWENKEIQTDRRKSVHHPSARYKVMISWSFIFLIGFGNDFVLFPNLITSINSEISSFLSCHHFDAKLFGKCVETVLSISWSTLRGIVMHTWTSGMIMGLANGMLTI